MTLCRRLGPLARGEVLGGDTVRFPLIDVVASAAPLSPLSARPRPDLQDSMARVV